MSFTENCRIIFIWTENLERNSNFLKGENFSTLVKTDHLANSQFFFYHIDNTTGRLPVPKCWWHSV